MAKVVYLLVLIWLIKSITHRWCNDCRYSLLWIIQQAKIINAKIAGVVLSIDRQEKAKDSDISATKKISQDFNIPVLAVTNFESIFEYVKENLDETMIDKFKQYRQNMAHNKDIYLISDLHLNANHAEMADLLKSFR